MIVFFREITGHTSLVRWPTFGRCAEIDVYRFSDKASLLQHQTLKEKERNMQTDSNPCRPGCSKDRARMWPRGTEMAAVKATSNCSLCTVI